MYRFVFLTIFPISLCIPSGAAMLGMGDESSSSSWSWLEEGEDKEEYLGVQI